VELMTASVVVMLMMGVMLSVMRVSVSLNSSTQQNLDLQENVRSSLNLICSELINAGSGLAYQTSVNGVLVNGIPSISVPVGARVGPLGAANTTGSLNFITPGNSTGNVVNRDGEGNALAPPIQTDMLTFLGGMGQGQFVNQTAPGPTANWGSTVYLVGNSIFRPGQVVVVTNGSRVSLGQITQVQTGGILQFANGTDPLLLDVAGSGGAPNPTYYAAQQAGGGPPPMVYPLSSITYFIDSATNPNRPMLKRLANSSGGAAASTAVADNIENLQVSYLVDNDGNGTTNCINMDSPALGQLSLIRGVTVTITGRSLLKTETPQSHQNSDLHGRLTLSQTVFFRNNVLR
jgi:hypothetical protein